ncbi:Cys-tRNA(Pro) deacylase [uncultured Psychrobacter sp.]|uniref:Cys-tRNA(Pro) deacylase n=1 Tax=uncultured Psychrobacter sp. TaxID=259303 RepID=UPI0034586C58
MTPAIELAKALDLDYQVHEFTHDSSAQSFGLEAAEKLGLPAAQVFKTLIVETDTRALAMAILPVDTTLNLKKMAKALNCKRTKMADPKQVQRSTGYVLGGVSPLGQKKRLMAIMDSRAQNQTTIYVSGGRRGLDLELPPIQLATTLNASFADIADN